MLAPRVVPGKRTLDKRPLCGREKFRMNSPRCATLKALTTGNAMKRLVALALTAAASLLSGCATYDDYAYSDRGGYYEDEYYGQRYDSRRYYYDRYGNRVYIDDYDVANRYGAHYGSASWGYPDYVRYNSYYSALWPTYRYYYDPFWSPGFYYGVTYFPRTYFGMNVGWYSWPYYQAYSPYRHSHADHYYDWAGYSRDRAADRQRYYGNSLPRYGSARNEAQILARRTGARDQLPTYYGASGQPGSIVEPSIARNARSRGQLTSFERSARDWNYEPYGRDGRNYRGFAEGAQPVGAGARGQVDRGGNNGRSSDRGIDRGSERNNGYIAPAPSTRGYDRGGLRQPYQDPRIEQSQESAKPYTRGRTVMPNRDYDAGSRQILPRQTREPYDPVFERHVEETPQLRSREVYRGRDVQMQPRYQPSTPIERSMPRTVERSAPVFQRSEPRAQPSYERSEPRAQPRYERPAPSFSPPSPPSSPSGSYDSGRGSSRGSSSSSSDDGGGRSSRGQLERIIRDDD